MNFGHFYHVFGTNFGRFHHVFGTNVLQAVDIRQRKIARLCGL